MSSSRSMAAGVTYEDCVYVIGGYSGSSDLSSVECYNPMVRFIYLFWCNLVCSLCYNVGTILILIIITGDTVNIILNCNILYQKLVDENLQPMVKICMVSVLRQMHIFFVEIKGHLCQHRSKCETSSKLNVKSGQCLNHNKNMILVAAWFGRVKGKVIWGQKR